MITIKNEQHDTNKILHNNKISKKLRKGFIIQISEMK